MIDRINPAFIRHLMVAQISAIIYRMEYDFSFIILARGRQHSSEASIWYSPL